MSLTQVGQPAPISAYQSTCKWLVGRMMDQDHMSKL